MNKVIDQMCMNDKNIIYYGLGQAYTINKQYYGKYSKYIPIDYTKTKLFNVNQVVTNKISNFGGWL